jgi:hypothetical protein
MNDTPTLKALPASEPLRTRTPGRPDAPPDAPGAARRLVSAAFGWGWRLFVGTLFCSLNYFSSLLVTGWLYRLIQGRVLYGWWKQSPLREQMSFAAFRATLGPDAPVTRPRWFLRENMSRDDFRAEVDRPTADGEPPLPLHRLLRLLAAPFRSFLLNLKVGFLGVLATFLLTGWGCALMTFSWEFGCPESPSLHKPPRRAGRSPRP